MSQFGYHTSPNNPTHVQLHRSNSSPNKTSPKMAVSSNVPPPAASSPQNTSNTPLASAAMPANPIHSPLPVSSASTIPPVGSSVASAPGRCCDTGRPIFTDPISGQSICSCQYDLLGYSRLAAGGGVPPLSMYSSPYPEAMAAYFPGLGADQASFYTTTAGLELKENLAAGATWPYPSMYHPYDTAFAGYPFNGYGMDINGARRKNATRETTSTLKAWLNEHKKNPYPTKGEKIMLAIITKMTLTQVSTWFANARRRLKKENKMTWEPRNRVEDDDNNNDDDDRKSTDGKDLLDSKDSGTGSSEDGDRPTRGGSEWSESRPESPELMYDRPPPHPYAPQTVAQPTTSPSRLSMSTSSVPKPRIWSLADMASKEPDVNTHKLSSAFYPGNRLLAPGFAHRLPPPGLPYARPQDIYRSIYGSHQGNPDMSLLENYTKSLAMATTSAGGPLHPFQIALGPSAPSPTASSSSGGQSPSGDLSSPSGKPMALNKV